MAGEINFGPLNPQEAVTRGASQANAMLQAFAKVRAGRAIAQGDTQGATDTLNREGMIDEANTVQTNHWTQDERVRKLALDKQAESAKFTAEVSASLFQLRQAHANDPDKGVGAVLAGFDQLSPILTQRGVDPQMLLTFKQQLSKDPDTFLTLMHDNAVKHYVTLKGGTGGADRLINVDTGGTIATGAPGAPQTKIVKDADGAEHLIQINPQEEAAAAPSSPAGAVEPPPPPPTGAVVSPEQSAAAATQVAAVAPGGPAAGTSPQEPVVEPQADPWAVPQAEVTKIVGTPISVAAHGYDRSPAVNKAAGGVSNSEHIPAPGELHGHALDFKAKGLTNRQAMQKIIDSGVSFNQLIDEGTHVHVSWGSAMRGQILEGNRAKGYRPLQMAASAGADRTPPPNTGEVTPASVAAVSHPGVTELFSGAHNKAPAKPAGHYEIRQDGPFAKGTVYKVETNTGNTTVLQAPPKATGTADKPVKLSPNEEKSLYDLRKSVNERRTVNGLYTEFIGYLSGPGHVTTGGTMGFPGVATGLGLYNKRIGRMRSIINQLTPVMRNGLPGAASDKDVAMFRGATVGFDKTPEANLAIARAGQAALQREGDYLQFLEAFANKHGTLRGSQEIWAAYADGHPQFSQGPGGIRVNKVTPWRDAIKLDDTPSTPAPKGRTWSPDKGLH